MNRKLGSIVSTVALLAVAAGAAAVNVKILHSNRSDNSVLTVQQAADVVPLPSTTTAADPTTATDPAATNAASPAASDPASVTTPVADPAPIAPAPKQSKSGKQIVGSVGGGGHGEGEGEDGEGDHHHGDRGGFMMLSPEQKALLRVAAIAQVKPEQARDAARGIGSTAVINRVKAAANQVGVARTDLAAISDLPPARGPGHGGEEHEGESDD